jgi:hypothetical protein
VSLALHQRAVLSKRAKLAEVATARAVCPPVVAPGGDGCTQHTDTSDARDKENAELLEDTSFLIDVDSAAHRYYRWR